MSSLSLIFSVFLALVASGYSLSCKQCTSQSTSCTGPSVICPSGAACQAIYTQTTAGGKTQNTYAMLCSPQENCLINGSASLSFGGKIKMSSSCCYTDNCTPTLPTLPKDNSASNGLVCRSCFSADSTWCYSSDTIKCTGDENMCLLQTTKISGSVSLSTAFRGCATKSICNLGSYSESAEGLSISYSYRCTNGNMGLHTNVYLPAVISLLLLKLLS